MRDWVAGVRVDVNLKVEGAALIEATKLAKSTAVDLEQLQEIPQTSITSRLTSILQSTLAFA